MERRDARHTRRRARLLAVAAGAAVLALGAGALPVGAAQAAFRAGSPFQSATRETTMSCGHAAVAPTCTSSASADARTGRMDVSAAIDSGAGGNLPGVASSRASAFVHHVVDLGSATAATITFHLRAVRVEHSSTHLGKPMTLVSAGATCDQCAVPPDAYGTVDRTGDIALTVTLVRGVTGGRAAALTAATHATASDYCDDFCVDARGTARAVTQVMLTAIDVQLLGVGTPSTPAFAAPAAGAIVDRTHYEQCDADCHGVDGSAAWGGAEPGMPVQILDGNRVVATAQADADGRWEAYVPLSAGNHTLVARAVGPQGMASTARRTVTVRG